MTPSDSLVQFTMKSEGLRLKAYQDSVGVWTIGYGHTGGVVAGQVINEAQALAFLKADLAIAAARVAALVKVKLTQGQFDALVDFVFNLGSGKLASSTLLKLLNAGSYAAAGLEFAKWVYAGGVKLPGLVARRAGETSFWNTK